MISTICCTSPSAAHLPREALKNQPSLPYSYVSCVTCIPPPILKLSDPIASFPVRLSHMYAYVCAIGD